MMVVFKISLILAFRDVNPTATSKDVFTEDNKAKQRKYESKQAKSNASSKSPKSMNAKAVTRTGSKAKLAKQTENYVIEVGKPIAYVHVDYELIPTKFRYEFDIICWSSVAKVFTADGCESYRTLIRGDKVFVYVTIEHRLGELSNEDMINLQKHAIKFNLSTNKNKLNPRAKSENSKVFFIRREDVSCDDFVEAFTENPNTDDANDGEICKKRGIEDFVRDIILSCLNHPTADEVVSRLKCGDYLHAPAIKNIVNESPEKKHIVIREYVQPKLESKPKPIKQATKKKVKGSKKGSQKSSDEKGSQKKTSKASSKSTKSDKSPEAASKDSPNFIIPAQIFITDSELAIYRLRNPSNMLPEGYLMTSSHELFTNSQKLDFNPLIIKIRKLKRFPAELCAKLGFEKIYVTCKIPGVFEFVTANRPLTDTVIFHESFSHLLMRDPAMKFHHYIQTQYLIFEIHGVKSERLKNGAASLFTTEKEDADISRRFTSRDCALVTRDIEWSKTDLLAVACYDVSYLLLNRTNTCVMTEQCHSSNISTYSSSPQNIPCVFSDVLNINELNLNMPYFNKNYIPESLLLTLGTCLQTSVALMMSQFASIKMHRLPNMYKRIYMVVHDDQVAKAVLNEVMLCNQGSSGHKSIVPAATKLFNDEKEEANRFPATETITGFVIDNRVGHIFYLEGPSDGFILCIWNKVHHFNPNVASVFLNTDHVFEARLYSEFLKYQPVYVIALRIPIQDIFASPWSFLRGHTPVPCSEAIKKLHLLLNAANLRSIFHNNLFPTAWELMSFGAEFGVPLRWKGFRSGKDVIMQ